MHLPPLISDLATILVIAGAMTLLFQKFRQPVVVGYIISGLILGPHTPPFKLVTDLTSIQTWAELGVIFLMFTLGLEFSFKKLMSSGMTAFITATLEILFFLFVGYGIGKAFGWGDVDSVFLGAMLSISSTTIIIKALDELKLKKHKFADLIFGVLIVEDLYAILMLVGLTKIASTGEFSVIGLAAAGVNLMFVVGGWVLTGYILVPRLMTYISRKGNDEMVTLASLGLCLSLVVIASRFGYSPALGAFIMGSILAETTLIHRIETLMSPLKDLFGAIFFVSIGMLIDPAVAWEYKGTVAILCVVTIVGKIFITTFGSLVSGQTLKNSVQVGFGLAQIGEFSFIIAGLGLSLKATSDKLYPIAVGVSLITSFTTPYLIKLSSGFAERLEKKLPWKINVFINRYVEWNERIRGEGQIQFSVQKLETYTEWIKAVKGILFEKQNKRPHESDMSHLAPWDYHLVSIKVHPNAELAGKNLIDANLRRDFDINVVAIKRGVKKIMAPKATEIVYPEDTLVLLGTDEKIDLARNKFENLESEEEQPQDERYKLKHMTVKPDSNLAEKKVYQSGMKEKYEVMIVGVEREGKKTINPGPQFTILSGDILWVVGEQAAVEKLIQSEIEGLA